MFSAMCIAAGPVALSLGGEQLLWSHPFLIFAITVCLVSAVCFALVELYCAETPLTPPKLVARNGIGAICVIQFFFGRRKIWGV